MSSMGVILNLNGRSPYSVQNLHLWWVQPAVTSKSSESASYGGRQIVLGEITESSLTKQLRELENDGFINRYDYCEVPPRVEYTLTELGQSLHPVLDAMQSWGEGYKASLN